MLHFLPKFLLSDSLKVVLTFACVLGTVLMNPVVQMKMVFSVGVEGAAFHVVVWILVAQEGFLMNDHH